MLFPENDLWYRGWILDRESDTGIFPKNVACLKPATIESGPRSEEIVTFTQETQVAQEIYNTLKEWNLNARELFLAGGCVLCGPVLEYWHLRNLVTGLIYCE